MIRVLVVSSILMIAQIAPAFAEKVTLACSQGPDKIVFHLTIDTDTKTMTETGTSTGVYPAKITDDAVTSYSKINPDVRNTYNRQTAQLSGWMTLNGYTHMLEFM